MHSYVIADVFTDTPLEGNPVAVFTDAGDLSSELMQRIAREMNLSETVFVLPGDGDADARIRIFTPSSELPFAGHPTLGTALILGEPTGKDMIALATGGGLVSVRFERADGRITAGRMRQPIPTWSRTSTPTGCWRRSASAPLSSRSTSTATGRGTSSSCSTARTRWRRWSRT